MNNDPYCKFVPLIINEVPPKVHLEYTPVCAIVRLRVCVCSVCVCWWSMYSFFYKQLHFSRRGPYQLFYQFKIASPNFGTLNLL